ncbi:BRO1-domain-containing protein [Hesseltinella vesiculosa]|uniref:BRO domain-containing protein 1 n=1 Tax=Hesseltinella vesiculosa TaxID=101127 RepID=A0A1X2GNQ6_9FUNG|nr:BRO1-domain-containing protein [Hesseltinella vesiculosa]
MASSQIPLISVPFKRTDDVNWIDPLNKYIAQQYQDDPQKYAQETYTLNRLRQDIRGAGKDLTGRDLLYRYFGQLELLELRFPVDEKHIKLLFTWYDAFNGKTTSQHSLAYEKASVIFNIAATLSAIASTQNRAEPAGRKCAFHFLQAAAGIFDYINDNFLHAPSSDLSRETVKLLSQLMLAQAHECFLENSIREKKKDGLIAKLASHAVWIYASIVDELQEAQSHGVGMDKSWSSMCQIKHRYYQALAQQFKAVACEADGQYGEQVARWTVAEQAAKEASGKLATQLIQQATANHGQGTLPPDSGSVLQELCKSLAATCTEKLAAATRDNDMIYHDPVPQASVLTPIDRLNAVKPIPLAELYSPEEMTKVIGNDIFTHLIPLSVHESASMYSEEQAKLVRAETEKCDLAKAELKTAMDYMKLPQALDKFKQPASELPASSLDPPSQVLEWAGLVASRAQPPEPTISQQFDQLEKSRNNARLALEAVYLVLDQETKEFNSNVLKYGERWTQSSSGSSTRQFFQDARNHQQSLDNGINSDNHIYRQFDPVKRDIDQLLQGGGPGHRQFEHMFSERLSTLLDQDNKKKTQGIDSLLDLSEPEPTETEDDKRKTTMETVDRIQGYLDKLFRMEKDRQETLEDLKERTRQDDIAQLLILNKKSGSEGQLFAAELEKYRPHQQRIGGSIQQQQQVIQDLTAAFKTLMQGQEARQLQSKWDKVEQEKRRLVDQFKHAKAIYLETKDSLGKGLQYYQQLHSAIEMLMNNCRSFAQERAKERDQLCTALESSSQQRDQELLKERLSMYGGPPSAPDISQLADRTQQLSLQQPMATPAIAKASAPLHPAPPPVMQPQVPATAPQQSPYPMYSQSMTSAQAPPISAAPPSHRPSYGQAPPPIPPSPYRTQPISQPQWQATPMPQAPPSVNQPVYQAIPYQQPYQGQQPVYQPQQQINQQQPQYQSPYQQSQQQTYGNAYMSQQQPYYQQQQPQQPPPPQQHQQPAYGQPAYWNGSGSLMD